MIKNRIDYMNGYMIDNRFRWNNYNNEMHLYYLSTHFIHDRFSFTLKTSVVAIK